MSLKISVITAVYNDEKYIKKSVESILNQTFKNFEYIIVDDGSTDNTLSILEDIAKTDKRIILIKQKNSGAATARNTAISAATGYYVALQDSDDISLPSRLETQLAHFFNSADNLISCTSHFIIDMEDNLIAKSNKIYKNINANVLKRRLCFCTPTMMIKRDALIKINGYNSFYGKSEDFDLILKLLENGYYLEKIDICLYSYRIRENSEGSKNNGAFMARAHENHLNRIKQNPENFDEVLNNYKEDEKFILKRHATEIFYSENYYEYVKFYFKNFKTLPFRTYFPFLVYATLPKIIKRIIKTIRQ